MSSPPPDATSSVWLVEDNRTFRETLARLLNRTDGLACTEAVGNAEQALRLMENRPAPDLALFDINLPGIDGIEAVRRFKKTSPGTLILMLTVFDDNERVFEAICAGANGYLLKTSPLEQIVTALRDARDGGAPMSPSIARKVLDMFGKVNFAKPHGARRLSPRASMTSSRRSRTAIRCRKSRLR